MRKLLRRIRTPQVQNIIRRVVALGRRFTRNSPANDVERWVFNQSYLLLLQWGIKVTGGVTA